MNKFRVAAVGLSALGALIGLVAEFFNAKNQEEEMKEEVRKAIEELNK